MFAQWLCGLMLGVAVWLLPSAAIADILGDYLGYEACVDCHGDVVEGWKTTPHADAFATLKEQGEEKQSAPGCVVCHVVAFEQDGGFVDMKLTPELKDVQCEACHGPGRKHVAEGGDPEFIIGKPGQDACRVCHTEGQDKNFDYEAKSQWVHKAEPAHGKKAEMDAPAADALVLGEKRVGFGNMTEGDVVERTVKITNNGKEVLGFVNLTTS